MVAFSIMSPTYIFFPDTVYIDMYIFLRIHIYVYMHEGIKGTCK